MFPYRETSEATNPSRRLGNGIGGLDLLEGDLAIAIRVQHIEGLFLFLHLEETVGSRTHHEKKEKKTNNKKNVKKKLKKAPKVRTPMNRNLILKKNVNCFTYLRLWDSVKFIASSSFTNLCRGMSPVKIPIKK